MEITEEEEENKCFSQKFNFDKRFFKTCLILLLLIGLLNSYSKKYKIIINIVKYEDTNKNKTDKDIILKNKNKDTNKVINRRKNIDKGKVIDSNQATDMSSMINMSKEFDAYKSIKTNSFTDMNKANNIIKSIDTETVNVLNKSNYNKDDNNDNNIDNDKPKRKLRVGVIGLDHHKNVGNNLVKYAIFVKLKELGVDPYIIGYNSKRGVKFITEKTNLISIVNFNELKETDYDILMVNSDQTWHYWNQRFYDIAFLKFAYKWTIPKFVYGASIGTDYWSFSKTAEKNAKIFLKNFTGISVREKGTVKYVKHFLKINATFVLDPTMLIDKKYYLDIINNYKKGIKNQDYVFTYKLTSLYNMERFINITKKELKYKILDINLNDVDYIEKFLYGIYHCKAVITNSFHGVLFSILFNKPFAAFSNGKRLDERFNTLIELFGIQDRFFGKFERPTLDILNTPLNLNYTNINYYRNISLNYLKKNLNIK